MTGLLMAYTNKCGSSQQSSGWQSPTSAPLGVNCVISCRTMSNPASSIASTASVSLKLETSTGRQKGKTKQKQSTVEAEGRWCHWRFTLRRPRCRQRFTATAGLASHRPAIGSNTNADISSSSIGSAGNKARRSFTGESDPTLMSADAQMSHDSSGRELRDSKEESRGLTGWLKHKEIIPPGSLPQHHRHPAQGHQYQEYHHHCRPLLQAEQID